MKKIFKSSVFFLVLLIYSFNLTAAEQTSKLLSPGWSFKGFFGKFDRAQLQRGYQVYTEVCAACHSMKYLSYRNLSQPGGPEFSEQQAKIIASQYEVTDGPNSDGEMFTRPGRLSDKFVGPYPNDQAATAANGGAYPPDMSVLVKARKGGADYIYSVLMGYEEPPSGISLDDGVYYNKYMAGNKIKMSQPLMDGAVEYSDGTETSEDQMAKDVVAFLAWAAEPHLEARHKIGFRAMIYLFILTLLVYFSMKRLWSRIESKV
tara:strand:- start:2292 stop:3074 length:783 start_codon:yes stop_codon:yes gene_type:complete